MVETNPKTFKYSAIALTTRQSERLYQLSWLCSVDRDGEWNG